MSGIIWTIWCNTKLFGHLHLIYYREKERNTRNIISRMDALSRADIENIYSKRKVGWNYWLPLYRFFTFWALAPHSSHSSFSSYTFQPLFRFLIFFYILSEVKRLLYTYNIQVVRLMNTIMDAEKKNKEESVWCVGKQRKEMKRFLHYSREYLY